MVPKIDLSMVFSSYMFFSSGLGYIEIYHHCGGLRHSFHPQLEQELSKTDACTRPSYCQERSKQAGPLRALVWSSGTDTSQNHCPTDLLSCLTRGNPRRRLLNWFDSGCRHCASGLTPSQFYVSYGYVCPLTVLTLKSTADSLTDESEFKGRWIPVHGSDTIKWIKGWYYTVWNQGSITNSNLYRNEVHIVFYTID